MSKTLFWYIFKDLLRIFFMASGALAGIMSFGGLLRPLTHEGLDASQVGRVLTYFMPAMTTYSLPVAALFATTMVYGRLSADNELTAARAGGLSLVSLSVAGPAMVLGLLVAMMSLLFLCFIVPAYTLKVEQVLYSNLAKLVASRIERTHQIDFAQTSVFAQDAYLPPNQPAGQQQVVLRGPTIATVDRPNKDDPRFRVPKEFFTADRATIYIEQRPEDQRVELTVKLVDGLKFPRKFLGAMHASIDATEYGPIVIPSPIKEDTKFMDVWRLKELYRNPADSRRMKAAVSDFARRDQQRTFLQGVAASLNGPEHQAIFTFEEGERYVVSRDPAGPAAELKGADLTCGADDGGQGRPVSFVRERAGQKETIRGHNMKLMVSPSNSSDQTAASDQFEAALDLKDCITEAEQGAFPRASFTQHFTVPMNEEMRALATRSLDYWLSPAAVGTGNQSYMQHELTQFMNNVISESNSRASFAISCLILVMVGCALGMMFRSGNFLTAFAVSFIPALLSITLIIAGQRTSGNVPQKFDPANMALQVGLALIWAGNAMNFLLAGVLLWRLHRQ